MTTTGATRAVIVPFIIFTLIWGSTWIVIRDQLGPGGDGVPAQWSVAYRFILAAAAMFAVARWKGDDLRPTRPMLVAAAVVGISQFTINFNAVYMAEHYVTSGLVATVFALLMLPNALLAWWMLGHRPTGRFLGASAIAAAGIGLLFIHELRSNPTVDGRTLAIGIAWTIVGLLGASLSNVYQARGPVQKLPLFALLAWAMLIGALCDVVIAFALAGPPVIDPRPAYWLGLAWLALAASVLCFSLYYPVVRRIGPGKAAYSSAIVPIIAMALSTAFEGFRWTTLAAAGAALAIGGMVLALWTRAKPLDVANPDAG
ncbi:DMT family transporter [Sphingomonas mesophila]|uniref:DMT family transporter n=1 Tax=Sphingomonas mesophila TaxID=2303576 RepID=UPI000E58F428|nr:DMT family transporter [Sphingomonas mesophila]